MRRFDTPMSAIDRQEAFWRSFLWRAAGDAQSNLTGGFAGFFLDVLSLDQIYLSDVWEIEIVVEFRTAPDGSGFNAAMPDLGFAEVSRLTFGEEEIDVAFERRLVAFHRKMVVGILSDEKLGWLVIDPKGVVGESAYETAASIRNPMDFYPFQADPVFMARRVAIFAERLGLDRARILGWYVGQSVLSVCWLIEDGEPEEAIARGVRLAEAGLSLMGNG